MRSRAIFPGVIAACLLLLAGSVAPAKDLPAASVSPQAALARLKEGNARFVANTQSQDHPTAKHRAETAQTQSPFAIIVGCASSRTAPELIFDQNIGDLFVVRTAGNLVDDHGLGSIEYAVDHLGTRLIVVLGHERCGAVKAALESPTAPGHVNSLVRDIQPAVEATKGETVNVLEKTVKANARLMAEKIAKQAELGDHKSEVRIVTGYYDLDTGQVEWSDREKAEK